MFERKWDRNRLIMMLIKVIIWEGVLRRFDDGDGVLIN